MTTLEARRPMARRVAGRNRIPAVLPPLASVSDITAAAAPFDGACGIYFLQRSTPKGLEIVYVGQSVNVHARVAQHRNLDRKVFDSWAFVECHEQQLDLLESIYIHWLRPAQQGRTTGHEPECAAPFCRRDIQHLLDGLVPTSCRRMRPRGAR